MKKQKDIIKSPAYWFEKIQNELFSQLHDYMKESNKTQSDIAKEMNVTKGYISQILNGNFNPTLKKLVEFVIFLGKVPDTNFVKFEEFLSRNNYASSEQFKTAIKVFLDEEKFEDIKLHNNRLMYHCKDELHYTQEYCIHNYISLSHKKEESKKEKDPAYFILIYNPSNKNQLHFVEN